VPLMIVGAIIIAVFSSITIIYKTRKTKKKIK
jgi:hypothetical protein